MTPQNTGQAQDAPIKHTPTPWYFSGTKRNPETPAYLFGSDDNAVLVNTEGLDLSEADKSFILTAVNSHEDLKQMLYEILNDEWRMESSWGTSADRSLILDKARNLLKTL